jgi:transposase
LPERFGPWDAVYQRFRRWEQAGRWRALFERLPADLQAVHTVFFDSSVIRAHPHAAGAPKKN